MRNKLIIAFAFIALFLIFYTSRNKDSYATEDDNPPTVKDSVFIFYENHKNDGESSMLKRALVENSDNKKWFNIEEGEGHPTIEVLQLPSGQSMSVISEKSVPDLNSAIDTATDIRLKHKVTDWLKDKFTQIDFNNWPYTDQAKELKKEFCLHCPLTKNELQNLRNMTRTISLERENWVVRTCQPNQYDATIIGFGAGHLRIGWLLMHQGRSLRIFFTPTESKNLGVIEATIEYLVFEDAEYFTAV